jgi:hypothetical protein
MRFFESHTRRLPDFQGPNASKAEPAREALTARNLARPSLNFPLDPHDTGNDRPKSVQKNRRFRPRKKIRRTRELTRITSQVVTRTAPRSRVNSRVRTRAAAVTVTWQRRGSKMTCRRSTTIDPPGSATCAPARAPVCSLSRLHRGHRLIRAAPSRPGKLRRRSPRCEICEAALARPSVVGPPRPAGAGRLGGPAAHNCAARCRQVCRSARAATAKRRFSRGQPQSRKRFGVRGP